jgi:hypothetical protein
MDDRGWQHTWEIRGISPEPTQLDLKNLKWGNHLGALRVDLYGRLILKRILKSKSLILWVVFIWITIGPSDYL